MNAWAPRACTPDSTITQSTCSTVSSGPDSLLLSTFVVALGIAESEEDAFAWIAEFGLRSDLPMGWSSHIDAETGLTYFVEDGTQNSTWESPLLPHLRRVVEIGRGYFDRPDENYFHDHKVMLWQGHKAELDIWAGPLKDYKGDSYFVNSRDGVSTWHDPRVAKQYLFDLQCNLLKHLQTIIVGGDDVSGFQDGARRRSGDSAQTLRLDRTLQGFRGIPASRIAHLCPPQEDYDFTLKRMSNAAEWLHDARQAEEEIQQMKLLEKVEERRMRKLNRKLEETICSMTGGAVTNA